MRVKVRLYRPHDMDLIILKQSDTYRLVHEMKCCLIAYANGKVYRPPEFDFNEAYSGYIGRMYQTHIELNPKKEEEKAAIDVLKEIRPGYRCAFIKTLFRSNCVYLPLLVFAEDSKLITSRADSFYKITKSMNQIGTNKSEKTIETKEEQENETIIDPVTIPEIKGKEKTSEDIESKEESNTDEFDSLFNSLSSLG